VQRLCPCFKVLDVLSGLVLLLQQAQPDIAAIVVNDDHEVEGATRRGDAERSAEVHVEEL
jgi:hypothetical protein